MKKNLKILILLLISFAALELGSYLFLIFYEPTENKKVFHWQAYENYLRLGQKISPWTIERPHPFFGPLNLENENIDLLMSLNIRKSNTYKIAILGGREAYKLGRELKQNPEHEILTKIRLKEKLRKTKEIEIISLALMNAKQPQQLQILNLFLAKLDYIIQIDDESEFNLPDKHFPLYFPQNSHLVYPYDHEFWQNFITRFQQNSLSLKMASWAQDSILAKSQFYYLLWVLNKPDPKNMAVEIPKHNWSNLEAKKKEYENRYLYFVKRELDLLNQSKKPYKWILLIGNKDIKEKVKIFSDGKILLNSSKNPLKLFI